MMKKLFSAVLSFYLAAGMLPVALNAEEEIGEETGIPAETEQTPETEAEQRLTEEVQTVEEKTEEVFNGADPEDIETEEVSSTDGSGTEDDPYILETGLTLTVSGSSDEKWASFTAEESGFYKVYSFNSDGLDPYLEVYINGYLNESNDDDNGLDFGCKFKADKGETYLFKVYDRNNSSDYSFDIRVDELAMYTVTMHAGEHGYYSIWDDEQGNYVDEKTQTAEVDADPGYGFLSEPQANEGYSFAGWSLNEDGSGDVYTSDQITDIFSPFSSDMELYAVYSEPVQITFDYNGGTLNGESSYVYEGYPGSYIRPDDIEIPAHPDESLGFLGWSKEKDYYDPAFAEGIYDSVSESRFYMTEDTTLYAFWDEAVEVRFHSGTQGMFITSDGDTDTLVKRIAKGTKLVISPQEPETDSETEFLGWSRNEDGSGELMSGYQLANLVTFDEDADYYAVYNTLCTVVFDYNGAEVDGNTQYTYTGRLGDFIYMHNLEEPESPYPDKAFAGWSSDPDQYVEVFHREYFESFSSPRYEVTGSTTLYAYWEDAVTVTFHAGEKGSFQIYDDETYDYVTTDTRTFKIAKGHGFNGNLNTGLQVTDDTCYLKGWSLNEDGSGEVLTEYQVSVLDAFEEDTDYYPVYDKQHTVIIDYNGGVDPYGNTKNEVLLPDREYFYRPYSDDLHWPDRSRVFVGWSLSPDSLDDPFEFYENDSSSGYRRMITEDTTIYAVWEDGYKVTFHSGEGNGIGIWYYDTDGYELRDTVTFPVQKGGNLDSSYPEWSNKLNDPEDDDGKIFRGWSLNEDGSGDIFTEYQLANIFTFDEDTDFYAVFTDPMVVTFDYNGGTDENGNTTFEIQEVKGSKISIQSVPAACPPDSSEHFIGWSLRKDVFENAFIYTSIDSVDDYYLSLKGDTTVYAFYEEYEYLQENKEYHKEFDGTKKTYKFVPEETGTYCFESVRPKDEGDPQIGVYDDTGSEVGFNDDNGTLDFKLLVDLEKGREYTVEIDPRHNILNDGFTFSVRMLNAVNVTFDANGGYFSDGTVKTIEAEKGDLLPSVENPSHTDESYSFAGWAATADAEEPDVTEDTVVTGAVTYYAVWKKTVRAMLWANGGVFVNASEGGVLNEDFTGMDLTLPENTAIMTFGISVIHHGEGYELAGWATTANAKTPDIGMDAVFEDGQEYYAVWIKYANVTFDANGGYFKTEIEGQGSAVYTATTMTLEDNTDVKMDELPVPFHNDQNKEFVGYAHSADAEEPEITDTYHVSGNDELYAVYKTKDMPLKKLSFEDTKVEVETESTYTSKLKAEPADASYTVTWSSSNEKAAVVDENGVVTAKTYGQAVITAVCNEHPDIKASYTVQTRFYDVNDSTQSYFKPVYWGADNGIVAGYDSGVYFGPDNNCTRAQFVTFLWRLAGRKEGKNDVTFPDLDPNANYYRAVKWAVSEGIIVGYKHDNGPATFEPEGIVTRAQVATMLWRFAGRPKVDTSGASPFKDINASNSAFRAVKWGQNAGVIKGYKDGTFQPDASCLRQHIVTFLYRYARDVMGRKV